ncbi:uncharacterized protein BJ212DRAFT_1296734 [Suillus subaureus]|uniref:Uncharacterized protein n=1 Tax=Suillus subaureus TaxID=48587 RepID=A0A9P7EJB1_9AGAM|nr:uncharacterized protein BJ212DRAFT_1296734 [Suillus subaureus]KAG1822767.1 hypothetical protein BJ212DRAFT_1296734 [Suillus subaureus]
MFTPLPFLPLIALLILCAYSLATCRLQLQVVKGSATVIFKCTILQTCLKLAYYHLIALLKAIHVPRDWCLQVWELGVTFRLSMSPGTGAFKLGTSFYNLLCLTALALFLQFNLCRGGISSEVDLIVVKSWAPAVRKDFFKRELMGRTSALQIQALNVEMERQGALDSGI